MMAQTFDQSILSIAQAYGPYDFWLQSLFPVANPDATWRALMVVSALKDPAFVNQALGFLDSTDSRVRGWACYYLGSVSHQLAADKIFALTNDPSPRVRQRARHALAAFQSGSVPAPGDHRRMIHNEFSVLISEDNQRGREKTALLLQHRGFITYKAETEQETLAVARRVKPQVIVTDNQKITRDAQGVPILKDDLSGLNMTWDLCRVPELRETILVMLTADEVEPIFLWQGGDLFLNKYRNDLMQLALRLEQYMR